MLSIGPGARQFSPSKDLPVGKSPHVGNIHYRHLPGYRLEVKTAGSGVSSQAELRSSALAVREFLIFEMEWPGRPAIWKCSGCPLDKNSDELGSSCGVGGRFWHRGRRKRDTDVGPKNPVSCREHSRTEETSSAGFCASIVRKLEVTKRAIAHGSRLENVDVTFLLLRRVRVSPLKRGMIMIVGSTGFGRL
jgi:hypothetical protein